MKNDSSKNFFPNNLFAQKQKIKGKNRRTSLPEPDEYLI